MTRNKGRQDNWSLRLVVFDFDQTLSAIHVFKTLAGWPGTHDREFSVPAPFACTEEGQIRRIIELNGAEFQRTGGFAQMAFGGKERVETIRTFLQKLHEQGTELIICTKGLIGVVKKCLHDLDLLHYFNEVYGNRGNTYDMTAYDKHVAEEKSSANAEFRHFLGRMDQTGWGTKDQLISRLMKRGGLLFEQCAFVEDDPEEIRRAKDVCMTLFLKEARGMTPEDCASLLRMAVEPCSANSVQRVPHNRNSIKMLARTGSQAVPGLCCNPSGKPWKGRTSLAS